jgi:hypothetical protein
MTPFLFEENVTQFELDMGDVRHFQDELLCPLLRVHRTISTNAGKLSPAIDSNSQ